MKKLKLMILLSLSLCIMLLPKAAQAASWDCYSSPSSATSTGVLTINEKAEGYTWSFKVSDPENITRLSAESINIGGTTYKYGELLPFSVAGKAINDVKLSRGLYNDWLHVLPKENVVVPPLKPVVTGIVLSKNDWTNDKVYITINGRNITAYSLDKTNWQSSNQFKLTESGSYTVFYKGKSGDIYSLVYNLSNIDKVAPDIPTYELSDQ